MSALEREIHRRSWLIAGAHAEWCYECGAWRPLRHLEGNAVTPAGRWTRPTGRGGPNPAMSQVRTPNQPGAEP